MSGTRKVLDNSQGMSTCRRRATRSGGRRKEPGAPRMVATSAVLFSCSGTEWTEAACVLRAAGTWEEHTHPFSKEPTAQMDRQDRHPRTLKSPLRAATITSQNGHSTGPREAVSTVIWATIYEGLSRVWFHFISLTSLFLIPPLSPTRRWRLRGLRDAPRDTD